MMESFLLPLTLVVALSVVISTVVTGLTRVYALKNNVLDIPNSRSSHSIPTPRGGGLGIIIGFLCGLTLLWTAGLLAPRDFVALGVGELLVAGVGFWDDHHTVSARWRFLVQILASFWVLCWSGGTSQMAWARSIGIAGYLAWACGILGLVWMINLYNFMDGIDGLAGAEAVSSTLVAGILLWLDGLNSLAAVCWLLSAAAVGFLVWNWPPAKIFMGDVGSGAVGLALGFLLLASGRHGGRWVAMWLILLGIFVVDTTLTLIVRAWRRDSLAVAHRQHAYQHASQRWGHRPVTLAVVGINILWLTPLAVVACYWPSWNVIGLLVALAPLMALAIILKAGRE